MMLFWTRMEHLKPQLCTWPTYGVFSSCPPEYLLTKIAQSHFVCDMGGLQILYINVTKNDYVIH